jgi:uncharacterized protein YecE (DUF72 family)
MIRFLISMQVRHTFLIMANKLCIHHTLFIARIILKSVKGHFQDGNGLFSYKKMEMKARRSGLFYLGTSGLVLPVRNKQAFPEAFQDKSRLTYYASLFNSIEINSSFYKVPMSSTVKNWAESVPDHFMFTFKLWREITHSKGLDFKPDDVRRFMEVISGVGVKSGCLLIQFPPSIKVASERKFEQLLSCIADNNAGNQWRLAVEFRDRSWYVEDVYDLLHAYEATLVLQDKPTSSTPHLQPSEEFAYLRFHGPDGSYKGSYGDDVLYEYAGYIRDWMDDGIDVFTYFNNAAGDAVANLRTLNAYVSYENV